MWSAILLGLASLLLSSSSSSSASALAAGDVSTRLPDAASLKPDLNLPVRHTSLRLPACLPAVHHFLLSFVRPRKDHFLLLLFVFVRVVHSDFIS